MAARCILSTVWNNLFMAIYLRSVKILGVLPITMLEGLPAEHIILHLKRSRLPSLDLNFPLLHHIRAMNKTCTMHPVSCKTDAPMLDIDSLLQSLHTEILEGIAIVSILHTGVLNPAKTCLQAMYLKTNTRFTVVSRAVILQVIDVLFTIRRWRT